MVGNSDARTVSIYDITFVFSAILDIYQTTSTQKEFIMPVANPASTCLAASVPARIYGKATSWKAALANLRTVLRCHGPSPIRLASC